MKNLCELTLQWGDGVDKALCPSTEFLQQCSQQALLQQTQTAVTMRLVNGAEMTALNKHYRGKDTATNVLAFYYDIPQEVGDQAFLGDIVICVDVVAQEAQAAHKSLEDHWAHMIVHAMLHLQGYHHENDEDFKHMSAEEVRILTQLNISNPYQSHGGHCKNDE